MQVSVRRGAIKVMGHLVFNAKVFMTRFLELSMSYSILTRASVQAEEKQMYGLMLPPLCFTMGLKIFL